MAVCVRCTTIMMAWLMSAGIASAGLGAAPVAVQEQPALSGIVQSLERRNETISSVSVRYRRSVRGVAMKQTTGAKLGDPYEEVHRIEFAMSRRAHREVQTEVASGRTHSLLPPTTGERSLCFLFDGLRTTKYYMPCRIANTQAVDLAGPVSFRHEYVGNLGLWLYDGDIRPETADGYFLPAALANYSYRILPERVFVDGHACVVLVHSPEPGMNLSTDKLWLDPSCGWGLRRRELTRPRSPLYQDTRAVVVAGDYRRTPEGVWFPWTVRVDHCRRRRGTGDDFAAVTETRLDVEMLSINTNKPERAGSERFPPGTVIKDLDRGTERFIPGGEELLARRAVAIRRHFKWEGRGSPTARLSLWACAGAVLTGSVSILYARRSAPGQTKAGA